MWAIRARAKKAWETETDSVKVRRHAISVMYASYYDSIPKHFFNARGVLDQNLNAQINHCRRINEDYNKSESGSSRPKDRYSYRIDIGLVSRFRAWWVLFLNIEEGPHLDKFINDSSTKRTFFQISHRCYHAFCYVAAHLQFLLRFENDDKTICQNGIRETEGGCNALSNRHSFSHCYLHFS